MCPSVLRVSVIAAWIASEVWGSLVPRADIPSTPTPGKLRVVENSGICETTPGVYQASGYGDLSPSESMWFWFFESRHDPDNAPLTLWLEGGRGTSSMRGLFQENGPCRLNNESNSVTLNPYSWNEVSNVLYIDQPVGVGFSYGDENVYTGEDAAAQVWQFLQIFFSDRRFAKYKKSNFGIWTELYGASYAAVFGNYFLGQNEKIANGTLSGSTINLKSIGVGGGVFDPLTQYPYYEDYAVSNPYAQLITARKVLDQTRLWFAPADNGGIQQKIQNCYDTSYEDNKIVCWDAVLAANQGWVDTLYGSYNYNPLYVRSNETYPPSVVPFLSRKDIQAKIGALSTYSDSNAFVAYNLEEGGTWLRNHAQEITNLINQNISTLFWVGDADFYGNYLAQEVLIVALPTNYQNDIYLAPHVPYNVNGHTAGQFLSVGTFSYVRVAGAGHQVGAYGGDSLERGQTALQFFNQTIHQGALSST